MIVGGGVIGSSVAFHLAEAGVGVLLLERDALASGSSGKPIGGVRAQFSDPLNVALGARSLTRYADFASRPGGDIGLRRVGYLFLLPTDADVELFRHSVAMQNAQGVPSRIIDMDEALRLCPYIDRSRYAAAAYSPEDGWAYPERVVAGYVTAAQRLGAQVRTGCAVEEIVVANGGITAVVTSRGTVSTGAVVCSTGAWSERIGQMVGVDLPVVPVRRQIAFSPPLSPRPPVIPFTIDFGTTLYFHNAGEGLLMGIADPAQAVGFERGYDETWLPLLHDSAARCCPSLADMEVERGWAGLYEMTPDHNALLGEAASVDRFLYATGFSGHGFVQAPAVGEVVRDLYTGRAPFVDVSPFSADRFSRSAAVSEANII
ncbi:FAD-binding oxidoreductase [Georgenia ruanii]|uniref:FAD-dependent oxidoreductase n=1 Tax=Georgenia ruanii TaxID=348442 RepID=A0A7J9V0M3_9MICO|nr:FAD-dependent oxidoreductase [Georgenia ruanii]